MRLDPRVKAAVVVMAGEERRSFGSMVNLLLAEHPRVAVLTERGASPVGGPEAKLGEAQDSPSSGNEARPRSVKVVQPPAVVEPWTQQAGAKVFRGPDPK